MIITKMYNYPLPEILHTSHYLEVKFFESFTSTTCELHPCPSFVLQALSVKTRTFSYRSYPIYAVGNNNNPNLLCADLRIKIICYDYESTCLFCLN